MGNDITIAGPASYITTWDDNGVTYIPPPDDNPIQLKNPLEDPLNLSLTDYAPGSDNALAALAADRYYYRDGHITMNWLKSNDLYDPDTDVIKDGLYYATGNITINGNDLIANSVTFVAEGYVDFLGPRHDFGPYVGDLLVFAAGDPGGEGVSCSTPVIKQSHSDGVYRGYFYAPHGVINISGSDVVIDGGLISYAIDVTGARVTVRNPYNYFLPPPGTIEITE
jgi:hypothetical protein